MPVVERLREQGESVQVIQLDPTDRYTPLPKEKVEGFAPDVLIVGDASLGQLQFVRAYQDQARTVCYYDNVLEINKIPYAPLIREFEREVDLFLVPSGLAKSSSIAKNIRVVGNPDLDRFEKEVKKIKVIPGRIAYFGGYGAGYKEALDAFLSLFEGAVVYPHPSTNGSLEKEKGALIGTGSSIQAVGEAEIVVIHRSSIGIKAALSGKKVYSVESDGKVTEIKASRESLNIPRDSKALICDIIMKEQSASRKRS